jgi:hypothetical protein
MSEADLSDSFDLLIEEIGTLGFCGSLIDGRRSHVSDFLPKTGSLSAEGFSTHVIRAEGMSETDGSSYFRRLRNAFIQRMGSRQIDVSSISSSVWMAHD